MNTLLLRSFAAVVTAALSGALGAQSLTGRVVDPNGLPIAGIEVDPGSGSPTAITNAAGVFTISPLPADSYDVEYLPALAAPWAARMIVTSVVGATNVGDVVLQPGFALSGIAQNGAGAPLTSCNINVYSQSGEKLFTPHDGSDLAGHFSVTVPAGTWDLRVQPPLATTLLARQMEDVVVAGTVNVGVVVLPAGHAVSGTVVDQTSLVPVGNTRLRVTDSVTGERLLITNDTANTFGAFSVLVPVGMWDVDFEPPAGNTHVGRRKYGVVVGGPLALGQVKVKNGALVSGVVNGPTGPVAGADIDILDSNGSKLFSPRDITDAAGAFSIAVPTGSGYRIRVEPPTSAKLVGKLTAPVSVSGATSLGTIALAFGAPVRGVATGAGPEANAEVLFFDAIGGEVIAVGNHTDARGVCNTFLPVGAHDIDVRPEEGSYFMRTRGQIRIVDLRKRVVRFQPKPKTLRCTLTAFGTPTLAPGGTLLADILIDNRTATPLPVLMDLVVTTPSGPEIPMLTGVPLTTPTVPLSLVGTPIVVPPVPTADLGKLVRLVVRFRDPSTQEVLDSATTAFVVE